MPDFSDRLKKLTVTPLKEGETLVICDHCTYPWICVSVRKKVSCPSCGAQTPRVKEN